MSSMLLLMLIKLGVQAAKDFTADDSAADEALDISDDLIEMAQAANAAHKKLTGRPIDPALIEQHDLLD